MIVNCPHCKKQLQFSEAQAGKIRSALEGLGPGKTLKLGCPSCHEPIELRQDGSIAEPAMPEGRPETPIRGRNAKLPEPPAPPDIDWLVSDEFSEDEILEDIPKVLILMPPDEKKDIVEKTFREIGYQTVSAESANDAIEKMRFVNYHAVIYHVAFEKCDLREATFHGFMRNMAMDRRRNLFYLLLGPEFHTLYDLEALALSANVVVNENDTHKLQLIFRKAMHDYEELLGPLLAVMKQVGKK